MLATDRVVPNYDGGGIPNLMSSIAVAAGGIAGEYPTLQLAGLEGLGRARNIVLLVIDGLGYHYLTGRGGGCELQRRCLGRLTSVCPSTTASAIPTFLTGLPPQQHGLTGWFTYFCELGSVLAVLPFCNRLGLSPIDGSLISPGELSIAETFFDRIPVSSSIIAPDWIADSPFNRAFSGGGSIRPYTGLSGLKKTLRRVIAAGKGRQYIYAYWPEFDALAHHFGVASPQVLGHLELLDGLFRELLVHLRGSDTALLVTSDHGFIDTSQETTIHLNDHPTFAETLMVPLCGEPRLAFCYVHPDRRRLFEQYVGEHLHDQVELMESAWLLREGWFGRGTPHPRLKDRIGHYALVMKDNFKLTGCLPGEKPLQHIGVHGGISPEEMYVPLIYAEC